MQELWRGFQIPGMNWNSRTFLINLKDDEIEWFEDLSGEREDDITDEVSNLIESASKFYDEQVKSYD